MAKVTEKKNVRDVKIDRETCIGCGNCAATCGEVFALDKRGVSTVDREGVTAQNFEAITEAENNCPTGAIAVEYSPEEQ